MDPRTTQPICSLLGGRLETFLGIELQKEADWTVANASLACFLQGVGGNLSQLLVPQRITCPNKVLSYEHSSMG